MMTNDHHTTTTNHDRDAILAGIASSVLKVETLETRRSDALDFHDVAVWNIRQALMLAYDSGYDHALEQVAKN